MDDASNEKDAFNIDMPDDDGVAAATAELSGGREWLGNLSTNAFSTSRYCEIDPIRCSEMTAVRHSRGYLKRLPFDVLF